MDETTMQVMNEPGRDNKKSLQIRMNYHSKPELKVMSEDRIYPAVPEGWVEKKLGDIADICMCKRIMNAQTKTIGDIPFYKIGTFGNQADAYISRVLFEEYKSNYSYPQKR
jgi:restriction endonuclease S subunit